MDRLHDWEDSVFGLKHECVRFLFIPSQMKFFLWLLNWLFKLYSKATLSQTVFLRIMLLSVLCVMRRKEGGTEGSETVANIYRNFLSLPSTKSFTRQCITLVKIHVTELKPNVRLLNIKVANLISNLHSSPVIESYSVLVNKRN